jgi:hypothetical protein
LTYVPLSSPGIAVRRTASLPLAYDRATQYAVTVILTTNVSGILDHPLARVTTIEGEGRTRLTPSSD